MKRCTLLVSKQQAGMPLNAFVGAGLGLEQLNASRLIEYGAVYVKGRRCKHIKQLLVAGDIVTVVLEESGRSTLDFAQTFPEPEILFEDDFLIAVNKPASIPAQPTAGRCGHSLLDRVSAHLGRSAGLVHRLDIQTSGITIFGKTEEATSMLATQFRERLANKRYLAVTGPGLPSEGTIDLPISKDPSHQGRYRASKLANGKEAITHFTRLFEGKAFNLVALFPQTGRTHQLRAHLASIGAPIIGDKLYGGAQRVGDIQALRPLLHAQALLFTHPRRNDRLLIEASVPADIMVFFDSGGVELPAGYSGFSAPLKDSNRF